MSNRTTAHKYMPAERGALQAAIRPLFAMQKTNAEIADALQAKGFRAPGNLPLLPTTINCQLHQMGLHRFSKKSKRKSISANGHGTNPKPRRDAKLPEISISLIGEILTNPGISEAARLELLRSTLAR